MEVARARPALIADLLRPEAFPHSARDIQLRETHISWVVLAGRYAYKIKKAVNFGFLDFSTVERRRQACEDEVTLNRRLCPSLYLGVIDILEHDGRFALAGPGHPIEPAVRMRRLPESGMLPALLERGGADPRLMVRLAQRLAAFHAAAAVVDQYGAIETVRANWDE